MGAPARRIAVIGGGIAGLAAAHALVTQHAAEVALFESDERLGGKLRTSPFAGLPGVDEGPDAFLARLPWATALAREVGLGERLTSPQAAGAALWWRRLHPIPSGLLLGMPTGVAALARSGLMTWPGKLRAALEPLVPRTSLSADSLGAYVRSRFGDEVHERLVDPLVGSIYAADTDRFSLAAVPQIADLAATSRSVLVAGRRRPATTAADGPVFYAPRDGMAAFADRVATHVRDAGGRLHHSVTITGLVPRGDAWWLEADTHDDAASAALSDAFDGVVLALPAPGAARLLRESGLSGTPTDVLSDIEAADVAMVSLALDATTWPDRLRGLSGYLVPKPVQHLVTAVSFGSQKWAHWDDGRQVILRISLGRDGLPVLHLDDEHLVAAAVDETSRHLGLALAPTAARLTRWQGAFPQYRPHHAARVATARQSMPRGLALAGAGYDGIGIPACVRSAQQAAATVVG
ncbi:MAG: protoporphyrinogen oxidase [Ilumatobacteraceae bacterium]